MPENASASRAAKLLVFVVVFIDLLGFGIVLPLLPVYGDRFVKPAIGAEAGGVVAGIVLGLLMSSFSLMQFLFAPAWGRLSDRIGRRPVLLLGLLGSVGAYALFGYASSMDPASEALGALLLLFVSRAGAGIAGATISTAQAVIADSTGPEERRGGMALIGAAFGIGFTFGPLLGAGALYLAPGTPWATGALASVLSMAAFLFALIKLPETRVPGGHSAARRIFDARAFMAVLSDPGVGPVILVFFLATVGFAGFESTLALLNRDFLGFDERNNFLVFTFVGFVLAMVNGAYRGMAKRVSEIAGMAYGIVLMGIGVAGLSMVASLEQPSLRMWAAFPSLTFAVAGFALLTPGVQSLVSRRADPARQGEILGVNQSCSALARIVGPVLGLTLYRAWPVLPFALGGLLVLAMLPVLVVAARWRPPQTA
jgi:MFS family permease